MVAARLDHRPQPDALLVVGDVLDLVGARPAVDLAQLRQDLGQRLAGNVHAEDVGRDQGLQLGRQLGLAALGVERGVADRLAAERVEPRCEVSMRAVGGDERHRGRDSLKEGLVLDRRRFHRRRRGRGGPGATGGAGGG